MSESKNFCLLPFRPQGYHIASYEHVHKGQISALSSALRTPSHWPDRRETTPREQLLFGVQSWCDHQRKDWASRHLWHVALCGEAQPSPKYWRREGTKQTLANDQLEMNDSDPSGMPATLKIEQQMVRLPHPLFSSISQKRNLLLINYTKVSLWKHFVHQNQVCKYLTGDPIIFFANTFQNWPSYSLPTSPKPGWQWDPFVFCQRTPIT